MTQEWRATNTFPAPYGTFPSPYKNERAEPVIVNDVLIGYVVRFHRGGHRAPSYRYAAITLADWNAITDGVVWEDDSLKYGCVFALSCDGWGDTTTPDRLILPAFKKKAEAFEFLTAAVSLH